MAAILGHDAVRQRFDRLLGEGRLHHAWLLHGPAGIGKRMLARALAADYLCERNRDALEARPACGECHGCRMMAAGSHPDFMLVEREWDEKKDRLKRDVSIEQVRGMLGFLALSGSESVRRVALIGEAERMNAQAANAMLKGLEEPAAGSLLLLVCEDALTLPATVRSRCMLQFLSPLGDGPMQRILEGMHIPDNAMDLAKQLANGQPGKVAALADSEIAAALLDWHQMLADPPALDIGRVQQWIAKYVQQVPHDLIVDVVLAAIRPFLLPGGDMARMDAVLDAARGLATWPQELVRRTLRPAPTLLAYMLSLRLALRGLTQERVECRVITSPRPSIM
jgi:DNA polymerase III subunit delta'